jgi:hypothetical protein
MVTTAEIIDEINRMREQSGIDAGRVELWYGTREGDVIPIRVKEIEAATNCTLSASFVGTSRFGRFMTLSDATRRIDCSDAFRSKIA